MFNYGFVRFAFLDNAYLNFIQISFLMYIYQHYWPTISLDAIPNQFNISTTQCAVIEPTVGYAFGKYPVEFRVKVLSRALYSYARELLLLTKPDLLSQTILNTNYNLFAYNLQYQSSSVNISCVKYRYPLYTQDTRKTQNTRVNVDPALLSLAILFD